MLKEHVETFHGIVQLIIVRVASLRRPLGIFSSAAFVLLKQKPFWSVVLKKHAETLHGIVRLIIVQVASFRRPLGIFSIATFIVPAKQDVVWLPLNLPKAYFT